MSSTTQTSPTPPATDHARRPRVEDVTVVVLTRPDGPPLDDLLTGLAAQEPLPQRVLVAGVDPQGEVATGAIHHPLRTRERVPLVLRPPLAGHGPGESPAPVWKVVEDARHSLPVHPHHWLWVLADDSRPEPGALAALAAAVRRNSRVAVVAPKLVHREDSRLLLGVGHRLTPGGRVADPRQVALVDQGQLDLRQDVLGAPLPGSLVRSDLLEEVGGLDPAFGEDGVEGLDLGWRSHLAGQRVVMAPDAVVRQGEAGLGVVDRRRTRLRQRQLALARGGGLATPRRRIGIVLTSALAALVLLLVKRPHEAADELTDVRAALSPVRGWGARWRFRRRRTVRPRDLHNLFLPAAVGWRTTLDTLGDALDPRARASDRGTATADRRTTETGPVSEEFADLGDGAARSRWSWPLATVVAVTTALALWHWQRSGLLGALAPSGSGVAGGELGASATDASGLWRSAFDGWRGGGLGHADPAEPWLVPASAVAALVERLPGGAAGTATAVVGLGWLLLLAVPAAAVTAHLALRRVTRRRWLRAALAVGWAGLAPLPAAVGEGRVGPALVHVAAPLLIAGYAVAATPSSSVRRTAATFATVLLTAVTALWVPSVLVLTTLAALALVVVGGRSVRARGAFLAVVPLALLLPWLPAVWAEPVRLLGGAGATVASATHPGLTPAWQLLLLHPGAPVEPGAWSALPLWGAVPLWLAALAGVALPGPARRATVLLGIAVLGLALALLAPRVALGELGTGYADAGRSVTVWPGTLLSLSGAALLLAAGLLIERVLSSSRPAPGLRTVVPVAVAAVPVVALLWGTVPADPGSLARAVEPLPAVAAEQARGPSAQRTLVLRPLDGTGLQAADQATDQASEVGDATYRLAADLQGAEPEPARILRDRARDLVATGSDDGEVTDAVAALTGRGTPAEAAARLHGLGVGFVQLFAADTDPVAALVDRLPGLTRVSSPADQVLWRVAEPPVARLTVRGPDGEVLTRLPATGPHGAASSTLQDLPEGSRLEVAEGPGWAGHATVAVDGVATPVPADRSIELPPGTHEVTSTLRTPGTVWHVVALLLAAVTAFLALPVGRTEDEPEEASR